MSDGPFKNLKLGSCWKRFMEALPNDAVDRTECGALASDALVRELLTDSMRALLGALRRYLDRDQLDFDPLLSVEGIFDSHDKTPFADKLQKQLAFRLGNQTSPDVLELALEASVNDQIGEVRNRFEEEFIRARDAGEIDHEQHKCAINKTKAVFNAIDRNEICQALRAGDKNAFKKAADKKEGLDEGPSL